MNLNDLNSLTRYARANEESKTNRVLNMMCDMSKPRDSKFLLAKNISHFF